MKPFDYIRQITVCCFAALLCTGCGKSDMAMPGKKGLPETQIVQKSIVDTLAADSVKTKSIIGCGGCIPTVSATLMTGVPVVVFSHLNTAGCNNFEVSIDMNGEHDSGTINTAYQTTYVSNLRVSYGQSCSGSVTVTCTSYICTTGKYKDCSRIYYFSFNGNGEGGSELKPACGKDLNGVSVKVPKRGRFIVDVPVTPSLESGNMNPDTYIIYYSDGGGNYERQRGELSGGMENEINFNASGAGSYWIKMYNAAICGGSDKHYLYYYMDVSPNFGPARPVKNH